jgi:hypothetical protein
MPATPPDLCWDMILGNPCTARCLSSWRWMWTLPQVSKAFKAALDRDQWVRWACVDDLTPSLWKSKANAMLALTAHDMRGAVRLVVTRHWPRRRETHYMRRDELLRLALAKHGGTCDGINAVFLKRQGRRRRRGSVRAVWY